MITKKRYYQGISITKQTRTAAGQGQYVTLMNAVEMGLSNDPVYPVYAEVRYVVHGDTVRTFFIPIRYRVDKEHPFSRYPSLDVEDSIWVDYMKTGNLSNEEELKSMYYFFQKYIMPKLNEEFTNIKEG